MLRRRIFSTFLAICTAIFLLGCEPITSNGAIVINGRPASIEISENAPDGNKLLGLDVTINSEFIGTAKFVKEAPGTGSGSKISFGPIKSKYGEILLVRNLNGNTVSHDVFIGGNYAGNVHFYTFTGIL
uniref:hypothetical protein n=1 Tax=Roseovarius sp. BRH_c41 TaxID=1629709 RepID=UPI0025EB088E|nr:hypothetical protein [Roseovarius sp. BRH_c41]